MPLPPRYAEGTENSFLETAFRKTSFMEHYPILQKQLLFGSSSCFGSLEQNVFVLLNDKSRMKGDFHVRFRERLRVKFPWSTQQRAIHPLTTWRNAMLHFSSDEGAEMAAAYYSIISTVKIQGRSAWEYLGKFLLKYLTVAEIFSVCAQIKSDWQYANS